MSKHVSNKSREIKHIKKKLKKIKDQKKSACFTEYTCIDRSLLILLKYEIIRQN